MALRFYNTLSRSLEEFEPSEPGQVRMYTCGPTVYDRAHIGNFRAFVWEDLLRRYLAWKGYGVTQVMNVTDVDDRTINAAIESGSTLDEITTAVTETFFEDWETLGLQPVEHNPRATEHIPQMIDLIRRLEERGVTYERDGSVYFAIGRFPGYGRLVNLDPSGLQSGRRVEGDENYSKDDPRDFVLWKGGAREDEGVVAVWDSPWGPGRPGWHVECSAMAMEYLGDTLDIHTGGVDNIFPHHVNEMAQSEAATGRPFARFWLHAAHLLAEGEKMSKSLGNYHTVGSVVAQGYRPSAIRYLLLNAHYRAQLNFTLAGLADADRAVGRLFSFRRRVDELACAAESGPAAGDREAAGRLAAIAERWTAEFTAALDDDLNVSDALAATFNLVRDANADLDRAPVGVAGDVAPLLRVMDSFERVFGVLGLREREEEVGASGELREWIEERLEARAEARKARDFGLADAIREELLARGVVLEDSPAGTRWKLAGNGG
jgi:cysteinyl-tRNA synthetase